MKTKNIMAAHEARMWIAQVIVPGVIGMVTLASNPQVREYVNVKKCEIKNKFNAKFHKN